LSHGALWSKLLPFALWIWATNLVGNLFDVADQFMLKHFSGLPAAAADALIGQYYSSRLIPVLLIALSTMVGSSLLPQLSHEWEMGRRELVRMRMRLAIKLTALCFTAISAFVLLAAPPLFDCFLGEKYTAGMAVLPGTLMYSMWFCATCITATYLLCTESAYLSTLAFLVGLAVNVVLNFLLAPTFGLAGVVAATAVANAASLLLVILFCDYQGMQCGREVYAVCLLPLSLCLGGLPSATVVAAVAIVGWQTGRLFDGREAAQIKGVWVYANNKLRWFVAGIRGTVLEEAQCSAMEGASAATAWEARESRIR
jgi:O-antigen/teichoic acid export membrane protein